MSIHLSRLHGIKNCDSVKKARKWLDEKEVAYNYIDFRSDGIEIKDIENWLTTLSLVELINKRSSTWKQLNELDQGRALEPGNLDLIEQFPTLIKRPVLEHKGKTYVGFNSELYQEIFTKE